MKTMGIAKVCKKLGFSVTSGGSRAKVKALLESYGVKPHAEVPWGRGTAACWKNEDVERVRVAESEKKALREARAAEARSAAPSVSTPAQTQLQLQDDDVLAIKKALEGHSSYVCRLGERSERVERAVSHYDSTQRLILIALNRLLKAAGLQTVPESSPETKQ